MDNEKLIAGIRVEQNKIAAQLLNANPQWRELQGAINALQGVYVLPEAAQTEGALEAQEQGAIGEAA
jgi:hypothetical protein